MSKRNLIPFLCILLPLAAYAPAFAATYYVSPTGSGTLCTIESPGALNTGLGKLAAGDTLYLRGGAYRQTVSFSKSGTIESRITISGYPSETAIIEGYNTIPSGCYSYLVTISGSYVTLRDLKVTNSNGSGIYIGGTTSYIINVTLDWTGESGLVLAGINNIADGCTISRNGQRYGSVCSSWGSALCTVGANNTIRKCTSYNNRGEGINSYAGARGTVIEDNVAYNNQATQLYLDSTYDVTVRRNLFYCTPGNNYTGILIGQERTSPMNRNFAIVNNLVLGCKKSFYWTHYRDGDGLVDSTIAYNTFVNATEVGTGNFVIGSGGTHSNTIIKNNLIIQENSVPVCLILTPRTGLTFSYNAWSKTPGTGASGTGDVICPGGDCKLAKTGTYGAGSLTANYFKILSSSPAINAANAISAITEDFFKETRPQGIAPDMGGDEYGEATPSPPSPPDDLRIVN